ncbi:hypothetical protein BH23ACT4_BH23ACT4_06250 [soil metagenome]
MFRKRVLSLLLAMIVVVSFNVAPAFGHGCSLPHGDHYAYHSGHYDYWDYNGHNGTYPNHFVYWYNGSHAYSQNDNCNEPG